MNDTHIKTMEEHIADMNAAAAAAPQAVVPVEQSMHDFAAEHRAGQMPKIQRQNRIIGRLQDAGYGVEQRRNRT